MSILQELKKTRLTNLISFIYSDKTFYVRQVQPDDIAEAMIFAGNAARRLAAELSEELQNTPPDAALISLYGKGGIDTETLAMFGLDKPNNAFEQQKGIQSLLTFMSYQFTSILMNENGERLYKTTSERAELAEFIREDKEFRDKISEALIQYGANENQGNG